MGKRKLPIGPVPLTDNDAEPLYRLARLRAGKKALVVGGSEAEHRQCFGLAGSGVGNWARNGISPNNEATRRRS